MAVEHRVWQFDIAHAATALRGVSGYGELFASDMTAIAERLRADPDRRFHLVMLRLDPTDDEAWAPILEPAQADPGIDVAAAGRLMLLLIEGCLSAKGIRGGPGYLEELLAAGGWPADRIELSIRGAPLRTFFRAHAPALGEIASRSGLWLAGGWLDAPTAARLKADLESDLPSLEERIATVALDQSSSSGLSRAWHEERLRLGLTDLGAMLAQPGTGDALWIVQD